MSGNEWKDDTKYSNLHRHAMAAGTGSILSLRQWNRTERCTRKSVHTLSGRIRVDGNGSSACVRREHGHSIHLYRTDLKNEASHKLDNNYFEWLRASKVRMLDMSVVMSWIICVPDASVTQGYEAI